MITTRYAVVLALLTMTLALIVLCAPASAIVGWDVTKLTDDAFDAWVPDSWPPMDPQVDGEHVVWRGFDGLDGEIFLYDAATDATTQLTANNVDDRAPQTAGDYVVWQRDVSSAAEIHAYRISTGDTFRLTSDFAVDYGPQTDGRWIVWVRVNGAHSDIRLFDTLTGITTAVTDDAGDDLFPQVGGGYVVWQKGLSTDTEIHLFSIANLVDIRLTANTYVDEAPQIDAGKVVWQANLTGGVGGWEIFLYDIPTAVTKRLTVNAYQDFTPQVDAGRVVWQTVSDRVYLYDATTAVTSLLVDDGTVGHQASQIDGDTVVWQAIDALGLSGIDVYDTTRGATTRLFGGEPLHGPHVDGGLVTWQAWDGDDWEIYLARRRSSAEHAFSIEWASVSAIGLLGDSHSYMPSLSADGRSLSFLSAAANLVPGDTNAFMDVFLKDLESGGIARASVSDMGAQASADSGPGVLSGNGRHVAFASTAANLVAGDTNGVSDIFLHDRISGKTVRISLNSAGIQANDKCFGPSVDSAGRHVTFFSVASNLVDGDTNGRWDVFVRDLNSGTTERVSVSSSGGQSDGESNDPPSISADGRYVTFLSRASNLVPDDTNGVADVFVHDRVTGTTERVSVSTQGAQSDGASYAGSLSADGRYVTFQSSGANLVASDINGVDDIFVRDRLARTTHLVSVSIEGIPGNDFSDTTTLSADGRFVAFGSYAGNLVPDDTGGEDFADVYLRDLRTGNVERISQAEGGGQPNAPCAWPSVSADGRYVAFSTEATNVGFDDTNGAADVFVVDRGLQRFPTPFVDIASSPYGAAIAGLADAGIVSGYDAAAGWEFRPENPLLRAQFAKMLNGAWGLVVDEYLPVAFSDLEPDVPDDLYPHEHVAVAAEHGITRGITATTFGPYRNLTRAQPVTMVMRSLQKFTPDALLTPPAGWTGVLPATDPDHGANIRLAEYNGLLDGIALAGWDAGQDARRGETAQVLANMRGMRE